LPFLYIAFNIKTRFIADDESLFVYSVKYLHTVLAVYNGFTDHS